MSFNLLSTYVVSSNKNVLQLHPLTERAGNCTQGCHNYSAMGAFLPGRRDTVLYMSVGSVTATVLWERSCPDAGSCVHQNRCRIQYKLKLTVSSVHPLVWVCGLCWEVGHCWTTKWFHYEVSTIWSNTCRCNCMTLFQTTKSTPSLHNANRLRKCAPFQLH